MAAMRDGAGHVPERANGKSHLEVIRKKLFHTFSLLLWGWEACLLSGD